MLSSCSYEDVEVREVRHLEIDRLDRNGVELTATLHVSNPNNYRIKVTSTDAEVFLDGRKAGDANLTHTVLIPPRFDGEIVAGIETKFGEGRSNLIPIILGAAVKREVHVRAVGKVRAKSFVISRSFDFDYEEDAGF